ncbi:MAG: UDP-N-acetylglucosamine 1-carboxyvinyltransferase [Deltaproteobacteria bacterium]|jgi:UDP-N-acetylglucosamine 1-carboxyvinyltransferase|nr:UDP-N-acetylglucosamine 1-carboxyvinyltransferase [Deltaproteobacteria bacterium]
MDKLLVEGGPPLSGSVKVSGAKNAALPLMAAAILADGPLTLTNIPKLGDLRTMGKLLKHMGGDVNLYPEAGDGYLEEGVLDMSGLDKPEAPHELVKTMRASALVLGPLLARFGQAKVSLPGGCAIGVRPIDMHLKALSAMGAEFDLTGGDIVARAPKDGLVGVDLRFDSVTVTGTENVMMGAVLAKGRTVIRNAAREPEVSDTARALVAMGAKISGIDSDELIIDGVDSLKSASHSVMPDRVEAGTLLTAVAMAGGRATLKGAKLNDLAVVLGKFTEAGVFLRAENGDLTIEAHRGLLSAVNVTTGPYPGFPTDMQAQFLALMCTSKGTSIITETIFENWFMPVAELKRLGADVTLEGRTAVVKGVERLSGAPMTASDLRASASLLLAALAAKGTSEISRVYHLDRGYDRLDDKLNSLGAKIKRVKGS